MPTCSVASQLQIPGLSVADNSSVGMHLRQTLSPWSLHDLLASSSPTGAKSRPLAGLLPKLWVDSTAQSWTHWSFAVSVALLPSLTLLCLHPLYIQPTPILD